MSARKAKPVTPPAETSATPAVVVPFDFDGDIGDVPVLLINPESRFLDLLGTICDRAHRVEQALEAWSCVEGDTVKAYELAVILHPAAQEVTLLVDELQRRARLARGLST